MRKKIRKMNQMCLPIPAQRMLRQSRETLNLKCSVVSRSLGLRSQRALLEIESGRFPVSPRDLGILCQLYGFSTRKRHQLFRQVLRHQKAQIKSWVTELLK